MQIGAKIKSLRLQKGLTQEELGERTNLTKGYISQLERDLNSPSIETLFAILAVLGTTPKEFFDDEATQQKIVYPADDQTSYEDDEMKYSLRWLVPSSNDKEMEPVLITFGKTGEFKRFEPSLAETFVYVLKGKIRVHLGEEVYIAKQGDSVYYEADSAHQIVNADSGVTQILLVATHSYL
jgi:transcriptional regulator with XRE-family HTH domain